jgi:hypothetical protein
MIINGLLEQYTQIISSGPSELADLNSTPALHLFYESLSISQGSVFHKYQIYFI